MRTSAVLVAVLALTGCSAEAPSPTEPWSFFPRHESPLGVGDAALLEGQVAFADGCLWVVVAGTRYLPLWPGDTMAGMIDGVPAILGPGSELLIEAGSAAERLVGPIPDPCANDAFWVVSDVVGRP